MPLLLLSVVVLWPGQAFAAAFRSPGAADPTQWDTATGWATTAGGTGSSSQPGVGVNVTLENSIPSLPCVLDLGNAAPLNPIGMLTVQGTGWGVQGNNTLDVGFLQVTLGGEFTIDGATVKNSGGANPTPTPGLGARVYQGTLNIINGGTLDNTGLALTVGTTGAMSGALQMADANVRAASLTVNANSGFQDSADSNVTLGGLAEFLGAVVRQINGTFSSAGLSTGDALIIGNGTDAATVTTGNAAIGGNLWVRNDSALHGAQISAHDVTLGAAAGGGTLTGDTLTATGDFYGYDGSRASLTGAANITGSMTLKGDSTFTGTDLHVAGTYTDDAGSKVDLTGMATFAGGVEIKAQGDRALSNPGFKSEGITTTAGDLKLAADAYVNTGTGSRTINGDLNVQDRAWLLGTGNTFAHNVDLGPSGILEGKDFTIANTVKLGAGSWLISRAGDIGAQKVDMSAGGWLTNFAKLSVDDLILGNGSWLEGGDLQVNGAYADDPNSKVDLSGLAEFTGLTTTIGSQSFQSDGLKANDLELAAGAQVKAGSGNITTNGLTLNNGSKLNGNNLTVSGAYGDQANSTVDLSGDAVFNGASTTVNGSLNVAGDARFNSATNNVGGTVRIGKEASFGGNTNTITSTDFIAGSLAVDSGKTLTLSGADVKLTDPAGSTLDGLLDLQSSTLAATGGAGMTFSGGYVSDAGSTATLDGKAVFNNNGNNTIGGVFTANGMDVSGTGTAVDASGAAAFNLNGGNLNIGPGTGPNPNTLHAGAHPLGLNNVTLGAYSNLYGDTLTVRGLYADDPDSAVDLSGMAKFYGANSITHTIEGTFAAYGMTVGDPNSPNGVTVNVAAAAAAGLDFKGGDLIITSNSQLRSAGNLDLASANAGRIDIDLNRNPLNAALFAVGTMTLGNNALTLRHTGAVQQSGAWTLAHADGGIAGQFHPNVDIIDTVKLKGRVVYDVYDVYFDGRYTPLSPGQWSFLAALSPNARRAAPGLADMVNYNRNAVATALGNYTDAEFEAEVRRNLQGMTAEAAVNHAAQMQRAHIEIANAALGYALGAGAPLSAQGFVPDLHASLMQMGQQANPFQAQQRRGIMAVRQRISPAGPDGIPAQKQYSVLANWQPASQSARQLVVRARPNAFIAGMAAGASGIPGVNVWGGYVGASVHQQKRDGYSGYNSNQNGFLVGGSVDVAPELTVGVYGGWAAGQYSAQGVKADIDSSSTHLGGFFRFRAQGAAQGVNVTGDIAYSTIRNDASRVVPLQIGNQRMEADYGQYVIGGGLEVAYDYVPPGDEYSRVTPFVAVRYSHLAQEGYTESGGLPLKVGGMDSDQFASTVGVRAARDFVVADDSVVVTPRVSAAWVHNWGNDRFLARSRFVGSPVSFDTLSVPLDRDAAQLGAGLDLRFKQDAGWDFGVKAAYGVDLRASSTAHNFFGGLEVNF